MAVKDLIIPSLGEGIMEATILNWHKKVGDPIQEDETIADIATDKVDSEVPSTLTGIVKEILFKENEVAPVGGVIARIETKDDSSTIENTTAVENIPYQPQQITADNTNTESTDAPNNGFYSPLVITIAQKEGVPLQDLANIPGTSKDKRLSKKDLLDYVQNKKNSSISAETKPEIVPILQPKKALADSKPQETNIVTAETAPLNQELEDTIYPTGNVEIIEMDRMRKIIAKHMKESQQISATVTSFEEVDVTNMVQWRNKVKTEFQKRENTKLTFTPIFMDCIIRTIKKFPLLNSSVIGDKIIIKKDINLGMATALPNGNLIVPVIKNASDLNLAGISRSVNNLANKARNGKLSPSDTQDGTFTISNVGSFGSLTGTPIINQPQVAILAIGTIKKRPVVIETPTGDTIGIRHMMIISMSYDHRIIDGALGSTFLHEVVKEIENWDINTTI